MTGLPGEGEKVRWMHSAVLTQYISVVDKQADGTFL